MYKHRFLWKKALEYEQYYTSKYSLVWWKIEKPILEKVILSYSLREPVLDFACGTWRITSVLEKYFDTIMWIDISSDMLDIAKKKLTKAKVLQKDIVENWLWEKFWSIFSFRFFLNTENEMRKDVFKKLASSLEDSWYMIFNNHWNTRSLKFFYHWINYVSVWEKYRMMSHATIKNLCEENMLHIVETIWVHYLPWFIHAFLPQQITIKLESFLGTVVPSLFAINVIYVCQKIW